MMDMMPNALGVFINIVRKLPRISTKGKGKTYIMNRTSKKKKKIESKREGVKENLQRSHRNYHFYLVFFEISFCNFLTHLCQRKKKIGLPPERRRENELMLLSGFRHEVRNVNIDISVNHR